jgi:glycogen debranching enzyme
MPLTILDGANFCVSDEAGDIVGATDGFFAFDTRFLSLFRLTVNGLPPLPLSHGKLAYFSAAFYLRNPVARGLESDSLTIARERFVGDGMEDSISIRSHARRTLAFDLTLEIGTDFADILTVKEHDPTLGNPKHARRLPEPVRPLYEHKRNRLLLAGSDGFDGLTQVLLSHPGEVDGGIVRFPLELQPGESWACRVAVFPSEHGLETAPEAPESHFSEERARVESSLRSWHLRVPQLRAEWNDLQRTYERSVADLASLRIGHHRQVVGELPAAGMPWFMTVFGRDTLITCVQTLLFGPEVSRSALATLAELQATEDNPEIDAEPGKILHELRGGRAGTTWFPCYYGTIDATPLYLVLLSEVWRWTGDDDLVRGLREPALLALRWIDDHGDPDGDGFLEYLRRSPRGLINQSWKDSDDSQLFRDGTRARPPIAPCEAQGYVYDAKLRIAELARDVWEDPALAEKLEGEARTLFARFNEAFWCEERGGYYALALDGAKRRVDALASNIGHLLWSGIIPEERVDAVVQRLTDPADGLWSGWGVRTMSERDGGFNPLSYHDGSVWPHDNSLVAAGLARYGRWPEAQAIIRGLIEAGAYLDHQLPEVFAGYARTETPFPIEYPTAARPQAWAAGAPILLLQTLLGLVPDRKAAALTALAPPGVAAWAGDVEVRGVAALGRVWDIFLSGGNVRIERT